MLHVAVAPAMPMPTDPRLKDLAHTLLDTPDDTAGIDE